MNAAEVLLQELAGDVHKIVIPIHILIVAFHLKRGNYKTAMFWALAAGLDIKGVIDHARQRKEAL
jgi:hypothetical protein